MPAREGLSRRVFLGSAIAVGGAGVVGACGGEEHQIAAGDAHDVANGSPFFNEVPGPPSPPPDDSVLRFFTGAEARELDALLAVVLPGDAADPGAREAGVLTYVDYVLATYPGGHAGPVYSQPPFAEVYQGSTPPPVSKRGQTIPISAEDAKLYGGQSAMGPPGVMRSGLLSLGRFSEKRFGKQFSELADQQQKVIVGALFDGTATEFDEPSAQTFATQVRQYIVEGMFSDPSYGGNNGFAGWKLTGFPGPQRAYTPDYLLGRVPEFEVESLDELQFFHPGQPEPPGVPGTPVLPVSGSREGHESYEYQGR